MKKYFMIPFLVVMIFTACQQKKEENTETIPKTEINPLSGSWKMQEIHYIYADTTYIGKPITYGTFLFTTKSSVYTTSSLFRLSLILKR